MAKTSRWKNARTSAGSKGAPATPAASPVITPVATPDVADFVDSQGAAVEGGAVEPVNEHFNETVNETANETGRVAFAPVPGRNFLGGETSPEYEGESFGDVPDADATDTAPIDTAPIDTASSDEQLRAAGVSVVTGDDVEVVSVGDPASLVSQSESDVEDLRSRLVDLQQMVSRLADRSERVEMQQLEARQSGDAAALGLALDPEVEASSRTLRLAKQTADAVVAEAKTEAAGILADAERQRSEIIRRSRQQAEKEFAAERDQVNVAKGAWETERTQLVGRLEDLEASIAASTAGLSSVTESITAGLAVLTGSTDAPGTTQTAATTGDAARTVPASKLADDKTIAAAWKVEPAPGEREVFGSSLATPARPAVSAQVDEEPVLSPTIDLTTAPNEGVKKDPFPRTGEF